MARMRPLTALAVFTLLGALLQGGFARETGVPVAVGVRLSQDENAAKLVFDLSRVVNASASALAFRRAKPLRPETKEARLWDRTGMRFLFVAVFDALLVVGGILASHLARE